MPDRADLVAFGERWNSKAKKEVAFDPQDAELDQGVISTGLESVDRILGGGFPRGRISMLYGAESAGKTLLAQFAMAEQQRQGGVCMYMDIERTFTPNWFELTGVSLDAEKLLILRPRTLEQAFDMITDALDNVRPDLLVLDSLPALVPAAMMDVEMEAQDFMGLGARKITEGVKKATQYNWSTAFVIINQLRMKMSASKRESPYHYPGGKALRHHCSIVSLIRRGEWLTEASEGRGEGGDARIGYVMKARVEKNKYGEPWQEAEVKVFFTGKVDEISAMIGDLIHRGVIQGTRGYYTVPGVGGKIHGWAKLEELIRGDDDLRTKLGSGL